MANVDFENLVQAISRPSQGNSPDFKALLLELFGTRYHSRHKTDFQARDAYGLGNDGEKGVPYAGLIHPENPTSGPYGGTSLVWFPSREHGTLIGLGVGTRGLAPDENILSRPGHRRRIAALRQYLSSIGVEVWSKQDPAALTQEIPKTIQDRFPGFENVFKRYGKEMYCNAFIPVGGKNAPKIIQSFFDLYAYERGWKPMKNHETDFSQFHSELRNFIFPAVDAEDVFRLLMNRRFVILQGPPGTGKTRLANEITKKLFKGKGTTVQFHPAVTYEDFIIGLSPEPSGSSLKFNVKKGWLLQASEESKQGPYLLTIDEVNRADLGKVMGEAVYLFEPGEIGEGKRREIRLPHSSEGSATFIYPDHLYVLATMNTADRSTSGLDLAIRRRFSFLSILPDREVIKAQGIPLATETFDQIADVFVEYANDDSFDLIPGHAYFLAKDEDELKSRFKHELIPLLDEYLKQGLLGSAASELFAVRDLIFDRIHGNAKN